MLWDAALSTVPVRNIDFWSQIIPDVVYRICSEDKNNQSLLLPVQLKSLLLSVTNKGCQRLSGNKILQEPWIKGALQNRAGECHSWAESHSRIKH